MSVSYIPESTKLILWGKAGGRCQYTGCNECLWSDDLTKAEFNAAYIAHIIADKAKGPRGDAILSGKLGADLSNLMLMCDKHHRLIDRQDVEGHPVRRLQEMKAAHETRIEMLTSIDEDRRSHVILYGATVGDHAVHLDWQQAAAAMVPNRYPANARPIRLGMVNSSWTDRNSGFWETEVTQLRQVIASDVSPLRRGNELPHASIFAFAPQPLLIQLGFLLSDLQECDVYQLQREPPGWQWAEDRCEENPYVVNRPDDTKGRTPVLVIGTTDQVEDKRVLSAIPDAAIWRVTIERPHNDFLKAPEQLAEFRGIIRPLLDEIKNRCGSASPIHVIPVTSVAIAVELGRCYQPKAMPPMVIYDQPDAATGFIPALTISRDGPQYD